MSRTPFHPDPPDKNNRRTPAPSKPTSKSASEPASKQQPGQQRINPQNMAPQDMNAPHPSPSQPAQPPQPTTSVPSRPKVPPAVQPPQASAHLSPMDAAFDSITPFDAPNTPVARPTSSPSAGSGLVFLDADGCIPLIPENLTPFGDLSAVTPWTTTAMNTSHPLDDSPQQMPQAYFDPSPAAANTSAPSPYSQSTPFPQAFQPPMGQTPPGQPPTAHAPPAYAPNHLPLDDHSHGYPSQGDQTLGDQTLGHQSSEQYPSRGHQPWGQPPAPNPAPNLEPNPSMTGTGEIPLAPIQSTFTAPGALPPAQQPIFRGLAASEPVFAGGTAGRGSIQTAGRCVFWMRTMLLQVGHRLAVIGLLLVIVIAAMLLTGRWSYYPYVLTGGFVTLLLAGLSGCLAAGCKTPLGASRLESLGLFIVMLSLAALLAGAMMYDLKVPLHELIPAIPL